ncbi:MAG: helix-turn-helix transcriptional regulator [Oscillibacter sp.]|nr:helix-turn-helix transcriptional regulator [Oscillibacter sp.]
MEEMKIGQFIRDRRTELGLTQQQLADKLGITDKAVSKWERAVSYPDITILRELAAALEVSVTELLAGEREEALQVSPDAADMVLDTVSYAETARRKNSGWRFWLFVAFTAACAIAALVVCICNGFRFTWSTKVLQCLAFGWAVCYPLLRTEDRPIRNAMVIASVFIYPLVYNLGATRAWHLGVVVVSLAYAWAVYWIFQRYWQQKGTAMALILLLGGLLHVSVNVMVGRGLEAAVIVTGGTLFLDVLCLAGAHVLTMRQANQ